MVIHFIRLLKSLADSTSAWVMKNATGQLVMKTKSATGESHFKINIKYDTYTFRGDILISRRGRLDNSLATLLIKQFISKFNRHCIPLEETILLSWEQFSFMTMIEVNWMPALHIHIYFCASYVHCTKVSNMTIIIRWMN